MLELNPNDNQGLRDMLQGCCLQVGDCEGARRLFEQFEGDASATFQWARVLERILAGDERGAQAALREVRDGNPFVEAYMTGKKRLPEERPRLIGFGDESEAQHCASNLLPAWQRHPKALAWLKAASR